MGGKALPAGDVPDTADEARATFFSLPAPAEERHRVPASHGGTGSAGSFVETAAGHGIADWKEMLHRGSDRPAGRPLHYGAIAAGDLLGRVLWEIKLID